MRCLRNFGCVTALLLGVSWLASAQDLSASEQVSGYVTIPAAQWLELQSLSSEGSQTVLGLKLNSAKREAYLDTIESSLNARGLVLNAREADLQTRTEDLNLREQNLNKREQTLTAMDEHISDLEKSLTDSDKLLKQVQRSKKFWKWTALGCAGLLGSVLIYEGVSHVLR